MKGCLVSLRAWQRNEDAATYVRADANQKTSDCWEKFVNSEEYACVSVTVTVKKVRTASKLRCQSHECISDESQDSWSEDDDGTRTGKRAS
jgi:hypothetical protein